MINTQKPAMATYLSMCSRYCLPAPWHQVTDRWAFRGPASPESALRELLARHTEQELLEAGLAQRNADGRLAWHAALAEPEVVASCADRSGFQLRLQLADQPGMHSGLLAADTRDPRGSTHARSAWPVRAISFADGRRGRCHCPTCVGDGGCADQHLERTY